MTQKKFIGCTLRELPPNLLLESAVSACTLNPSNKPRFEGMSKLSAETGFVLTPQHIAMVTTKYWGSGGVKLTVGFMETTVPELQNKILRAMNLWGLRANVEFVLSTVDPQVRISRGQGGYWSYLGTDILHIPRNQQTMNLEGFTLRTSDAEYVRVIAHEAGHVWGCPHEHMRADLVKLLDVNKTVAYFRRTQGWSPQMVQEQVLTPLDESSLMATPADQDSIMCYQLPGSITKNGQPIRGGSVINETDYAFMAKQYPKAIVPVPPPPVNPPPPVVNPPTGSFRIVVESSSPITVRNG